MLRASYRQLAGLPEAPTKVDFPFYVAQNHLKASTSLMVDKKQILGMIILRILMVSNIQFLQMGSFGKGYCKPENKVTGRKGNENIQTVKTR